MDFLIMAVGDRALAFSSVAPSKFSLDSLATQ